MPPNESRNEPEPMSQQDQATSFIHLMERIANALERLVELQAEGRPLPKEKKAL